MVGALGTLIPYSVTVAKGQSVHPMQAGDARDAGKWKIEGGRPCSEKQHSRPLRLCILLHLRRQEKQAVG